MSPPAGKSVDWLDALNALGRDVVRERLCEDAFLATTADDEIERAREAGQVGKAGVGEAAASETGGDRSAGGGAPPASNAPLGDEYPENPAHAAKLFLCEKFAPEDPGRASGATWRLVTWNKQIYVWSEGRWTGWADDVIRSIARDWANTKTIWTPKRGRTPYVSTDRSLSELLSAVRDMTCIVTDGMGKWLARAYFEDGDHGYRMDAPWRVLTEKQRRAEGLADPAKLLVTSNGMLNVESLVHDRVDLMPPNERLFAANPIPHPWPESATEAARAGRMDAWFEEHCPQWIRQQDWIDGDRENFSWIMNRQMGRAMISDMSSEQVVMWIGAPGSGKGTQLEAYLGVFGDAALGGMTMDALADPSQIEPIEGKRLIVFPDDESTQSHSKLAIGKTLCKMGSGEILHARVLYRGSHQFRCQAVTVIVANRIPNLRDPGGALAKRSSCFVFQKSVRGTANEDVGVKDRIISEVPSIMVHIVWEGLRPYLIDKAASRDPLPRPDGHDQISKLFSDQADTMGAFVDDCLECNKSTDVVGVPTGEMPSIWINVLYELYQAWAARHGKGDGLVPSLSKFAQDLHSAVVGWGLPPSKGKVLRDEHNNVVGNRPSHWFGIKLRDGVLAELYDGPNDEKLPRFGVHPATDLDYESHRVALEGQARRADDAAAASPPPSGAPVVPEQGVSNT